MLSKFAETWICLKTSLKLLSCFGLYVWNSTFLLISSFTMFMCAMHYGGILICLFMTFISYSPVAISFNSCESDEKLSVAKKMGRGLTIFSKDIIFVFASSSSSSSLSKELIIDTGLLGWYLFIFGCFQSVDITGLFRVLFLPLTSFHEAPTFVLCVLCIICFTVSVSLVHKFSFSSRFVQTRIFFYTHNFVAG